MKLDQEALVYLLRVLALGVGLLWKIPPVQVACAMWISNSQLSTLMSSTAATNPVLPPLLATKISFNGLHATLVNDEDNRSHCHSKITNSLFFYQKKHRTIHSDMSWSPQNLAAIIYQTESNRCVYVFFFDLYRKPMWLTRKPPNRYHNEPCNGSLASRSRPGGVVYKSHDQIIALGNLDFEDEDWHQ